MTQQDNLYIILNVNPSASDKEIKEAYRRKSMESHPDRGGDPKTFQKVKDAYDILSNKEKRDRYDIMINLVRVSAPDVQIVDNTGKIKFDIKQGMGTITVEEVK